MSYIATFLVTKNDKEDLLKTFKCLDKDGNGQLNRLELIEGLIRFYFFF